MSEFISLIQPFIPEQVYYMDSMFAMGHVVIRRKRNVVGDEPQYVILFRCIQSMNPAHPFNTCYTGGGSACVFVYVLHPFHSC